MNNMTGLQQWSLLVLTLFVFMWTVTALSRHRMQARVAKHMIDAGMTPKGFLAEAAKATADDVR